MTLNVLFYNKILNFLFFELNYYNIGVFFKYLKNIFVYLVDSSVWLANILIDITIVDVSTLQISKIKHFLVIYNLLGINYNFRLQLFSFISNIMESVSHKFYSAIWLEREIWDMFGVFSIQNPDIRRILTDYGFEGFPLLKSFPLTGFSELFYDENFKKTNYKFLELGQELRKFQFLKIQNNFV